MSNIPKHEFVEGVKGSASCWATFPPDDRSCGYNRGSDVHQLVEGTSSTDALAAHASGQRPGHRAVPWAQLPLPAKLVVLFVFAGAGMVFLSACAAASYWVLEQGGLVG